jgi:hypothetical protein
VTPTSMKDFREEAAHERPGTPIVGNSRSCIRTRVYRAKEKAEQGTGGRSVANRVSQNIR